jgi:hypothetical protein
MTKKRIIRQISNATANARHSVHGLYGIEPHGRPSFPGSGFWPCPGQHDVALLNLGISTFKTEKKRAKRTSPTAFLSANRLGCLERTANPYHIHGGILPQPSTRE